MNVISWPLLSPVLTWERRACLVPSRDRRDRYVLQEPRGDRKLFKMCLFCLEECDEQFYILRSQAYLIYLDVLKNERKKTLFFPFQDGPFPLLTITVSVVFKLTSAGC